MSPIRRQDVDWFDMDEVEYRASRLLKALGNPKTYALIKLLRAREVLSVDEMARELNRAQPTVSKMLRPLRDQEVVRYQRVGNVSYYTLKDPEAIARILKEAETHADRAGRQIDAPKKKGR